MRTLRTLLLPALLSSLMAACCSETRPRFWEVRDGTSRTKAYTVDTAEVPTTKMGAGSLIYLDSSGKPVQPAKPRMVRQISEQEWLSATSGASYALWYCGRCKGCWAKAKPR